VLAQPDPARGIPIRRQTGPTAHVGMKPVSAHDPSTANRSAIDDDPGGINPFYLLSPQCYDANVLCAFYQNSMKLSSAYSQPEAVVRKRRFSLQLLVQKSDATEADPISASQIHTNPTQRIKRVGHKTFAASLIDWRLGTIGKYDIKTNLTCSQGSSESGRSPTNNEHISLRWCEGGNHHFNRIISRQNPGPMAIRTP
jgi:hypothetical protein